MIARLHTETRECVQAWQAELDLRLEIHRLEIQADKEVKLHQLDMEMAKVASISSFQQNISS